MAFLIAPTAATVQPPQLTNVQVRARAEDLARKFPGHVQVCDIGDSYLKTTGRGGDDILALELTGSAHTGPRPVFEVVAGIHPRETAAPLLTMDWAQRLLEGYGKDPQLTHLLDNCDVSIVPMANPDANAMVEQGIATGNQDAAMQRKNVDPDPLHGVDLNRNFDAHFTPRAPDADQTAGDFPGPAASSEPETRALENYTTARRPSFFLDIHSCAGVVLYPPGYTTAPSADSARLAAAAKVITAVNGYPSAQVSQLYPVTGDAIDWVHDTLGSVSAGIELNGDTFQPSPTVLADIEHENLPALDAALGAAAGFPVPSAPAPSTT